jgi:signal transduction histidine kinase/ActR/RegA family two-component response regulator
MDAAVRLESFVEMLRHLREPLLLAWQGGKIVAANAAGADALGTSVAALEGASLAAFVIDPDGLHDWLKGQKADRPIALRAQDGRRFVAERRPIADDLLLLRLSGGAQDPRRAQVFSETLDWVRRTSAAPATPDQQEEGPSRLERLHAFTRTLAQAITPAHVAEAVVDMGIVATTARSGGLWLLSADGTYVCLARAVGLGGPRPEDFTHVMLDRRPRMPILDAIGNGAPVWIESCAQMQEQYPEVFRAFSRGVDSALACIPLFAQGRCTGGLVYNYEGARRFVEEERAFLQVMAWHSAQAIERSRLYAAEKGAREDSARLYQEALEADRQKDEFLAMLSHELRNPLAPIVTALELMKLRGIDDFATERAIISRNVQHVVRLVDDLLDVARITRGKVVLRRELCEMSQVIAKAVEMIMPLVDERGQTLTMSAPVRGLPVLADQARLTQAIANLLSNANKYTEAKGQIAVVASAEDSDAVVRVSDSGIGIAPETLPKIFDLFVQEKRALDRSQGGLGIGLTVVRGLVRLHGGSVSAKSEGLGRGSEFTIRIPLASREALAAAAPVEPSSSAALGPEAGGLRVLVVDDNADGADMVCESLRTLGYGVRVAYDAASALEVAVEFAPDLVLVDIGLPGMNGYELAGRLRKMDVPPMRIVALTGYGQEEDFQRSREAGFDEHLVKPMHLDALRALLDRCRDAEAPPRSSPRPTNAG